MSSHRVLIAKFAFGERLSSHRAHTAKAMAACRSRRTTSRRPRVSPGRAFCTASSTELVECVMPAHARLLARSSGSTASCLDCLVAALQDLPRRRTPPRALQMSRRGSRGAARLFGIAFGTALDACRSLRGTGICMLSVEHACTRACKHERHAQNCYCYDLVSTTM
jgi:hypothetical protein